MKYFLDTEFIEDGKTIEPISLALVSEDDRELYIEFPFDENKANDWIRENVIPHLKFSEKTSRKKARDLILDFIGFDSNLEIWAWYGAYDWVLFCQLFGRMIDLPPHFPMFIHDLRQITNDPGVDQPEEEHFALADARWLRETYWKVFSNKKPRSRFPQLSPEARNARKPPPPHILANSINEVAHESSRRVRAVKAVKLKRESIPQIEGSESEEET